MTSLASGASPSGRPPGRTRAIAHNRTSDRVPSDASYGPDASQRWPVQIRGTIARVEQGLTGLVPRVSFPCKRAPRCTDGRPDMTLDGVRNGPEWPPSRGGNWSPDQPVELVPVRYGPWCVRTSPKLPSTHGIRRDCSPLVVQQQAARVAQSSKRTRLPLRTPVGWKSVRLQDRKHEIGCARACREARVRYPQFDR